MMAKTGSELLVVFAREPEPGRGKTRLARQTGAPFAHTVYQRLLRRTLPLARRVVRSRQGGHCCRLVLAGDWRSNDPSDAPFLENWCSQADADLVAQRGEDVGARMSHAFAHGFDRGASRIVLIGCDCPTFSPADLHASLDALHSHDVVIAPVADGGYSLIGLSEPTPRLFEAMQWSVSTVFAETLSRASGKRVARLREQSDIDDLADWRHWCEQRSARGLPEAAALVGPSSG